LKNKILLFFLLNIITNCVAQLIVSKPAEILVGELNFNTEVVKKFNIKSITLSKTDKPDGSVIIDKGAVQVYEFDKNGNVACYYYTVLNRMQKEEVEVRTTKKKKHSVTTKTVVNYINDTVFIYAFYDSLNRIILKRLKTGNYYEANYYEYNKQSQIIKEVRCKETNISNNKNNFILGIQNTISSETFFYTTLSPTQIKKSCLNDEGREYKKAIINYDEKGNRNFENYEFLVSWMRQENKYQYNESGRMFDCLKTRNDSGEIREHSVFEYDKNGNILTQHKFKNDELTDEINYLFNESNSLPKSEVNRENKNSSISIIKYAYTFY
jgi:hypothetical protein